MIELKPLITILDNFDQIPPARLAQIKKKVLALIEEAREQAADE